MTENSERDAKNDSAAQQFGHLFLWVPSEFHDPCGVVAVHDINSKSHLPLVLERHRGCKRCTQGTHTPAIAVS
jgi:hypothetical protein